MGYSTKLPLLIVKPSLLVRTYHGLFSEVVWSCEVKDKRTGRSKTLVALHHRSGQPLYGRSFYFALVDRGAIRGDRLQKTDLELVLDQGRSEAISEMFPPVNAAYDPTADINRFSLKMSIDPKGPWRTILALLFRLLPEDSVCEPLHHWREEGSWGEKRKTLSTS